MSVSLSFTRPGSKRKSIYAQGTGNRSCRKVFLPPLCSLLIRMVFLLLITGRIAVFSQTAGAARESKPWTYWWWMGSAVTPEGITSQLEAFRQAGLGGVHIIPVYGVKGEEDRFIPFLSHRWMEMYQHTLTEAARLDMGVDMSTGTGWPFGGPWVRTEDASKYFSLVSFSVFANQPFSTNLYGHAPDKDCRITAVVAVDSYKEGLDITSSVAEDGMLHWVSDKPYVIYVMYLCPTGQQVKRAAPGGEGPVIDVFSKKAMSSYLAFFDSCFRVTQSPFPRCFYNDSYEVFRANWTENFFDEFKKRRGYDLRRFIHVFADSVTHDDRSERIWQDYHETISDLMLDNFTRTWVKWAGSHHCMTRNQAHGSPGNLLDLYAAAEIPETESFGSSRFDIPGLRYDTLFNEKQFGRPDVLYFKFASSAAHVTGKKYVSSETGTWLADHFQVALSMVKPQIDELFTAGINHIFYHGITYSEKNKPFPGNLFYASTNFGPSSHFWNELPQLNAYVTRCQQILQSTVPQNDFLLYFPVYDLWTSRGNQQCKMLTIHEATSWFDGSAFGRTARLLHEKGYCFDYISDAQIQMLVLDNFGNLLSGKISYKALVIPPCKYMPLKTLRKIEILARKGAIIIFMDAIPVHHPGYYEAAKKEKDMAAIASYLKKLQLVYVSDNILHSLSYVGILPEPLAEKKLSFIRKKKGDGTVYFIANLSSVFHEGEVELNIAASHSLVYYDPLHDKKGKLRFTVPSTGKIRFYLQLEPGESCFIEANAAQSMDPEWTWYEKTELLPVKGKKWILSFTEGTPSIGKKIKMKQPAYWTDLCQQAKYYNGMAVYSFTFDIPGLSSGDLPCLLELGDLRETAVIRLNNKEIGHLWCLPSRLLIPAGTLKEKENVIEIAVTNLSINRIIEMDRKNIPWKNFYDINFVNIRYQPFDASHYSLSPSGLSGAIKIYKLKMKQL